MSHSSSLRVTVQQARRPRDSLINFSQGRGLVKTSYRTDTVETGARPKQELMLPFLLYNSSSPPWIGNGWHKLLRAQSHYILETILRPGPHHKCLLLAEKASQNLGCASTGVETSRFLSALKASVQETVQTNAVDKHIRAFNGEAS